MYHIFVSLMAYDRGQSGISDYMNNVINELSKNNHLDILILKNDIDIFPVKNENISFIPVSEKLARPIFNMLWHTFILPWYFNFSKYDFIYLPAGNRRIFCKYPKFTITTFHDLSQYRPEI